jgi:membrane associated rhomboid family serine protease
MTQTAMTLLFGSPAEARVPNLGASGKANGGGVAFFAHVGGFVFGYLVARLLAGSGRVRADVGSGALRAPA